MTVKTVIVPLDGSDDALRAVPVAATVARAFAADLVLMTTPMTMDVPDRSSLPVWLPEAADASGYERVTTELAVSNDVLAAIVGCVERAEDPVLCMATHGRGALGTAVLGSVAQRTVRELPVPVALVGPNFDPQWQLTGPLVVCHDGSSASNAILSSAREWSERLGLGIVVVHVAHPTRGAPSVPSGATESALDFLRGRLVDGGLRVMADRHPPSGILGLADEVGASLIALSTHGRTALPRFTLGRVAGAVIHAAPCPVLVTRPEELSRPPA
jgi:nucleotide-binding universal stress UspA family protein